ncbi:MAG: hypothetical protein IT162_19055 [Bryobacterales bacterium]|nr:hypothetical protein [Bryobacterales bacterium]
MPRPTRRQFFAAAISTRMLTAADFKPRPFPDWDEDTVMRVLVDSPWARVRKVKFSWYGWREEARQITARDIPGTNPAVKASSTAPGGSPVGGIGSGKMRNKLPDGVDLIFRWSSALPVRQAKALYRARRQGKPAQATQMVEARGAPGYVLEIFGLPIEAGHAGAEALSSRLQKSAVLRTKTGVVRRAERAQATLTGEEFSVSIVFPRGDAPLTAADGELECSGEAELFAFRERFKLRDMTYLGSIEL